MYNRSTLVYMCLCMCQCVHGCMKYGFCAYSYIFSFHCQLSSLHIANITALNYYDLVTASEGNDSVGLSLRYVPAMGYSKPYPFGYCEYGPVWAIHYVPGYLFWPPIPKRVCHRPCPIYGYRCRPSCCQTYCIYRYVWRYYGYYCLPYGWQKVCYEQHNCCKASCGYGYPYCYL